MKKTNVFVLAALTAGIFFTSCNQNGVAGKVDLKAATDSASYAIGVNFGNGLKQNLSTFPGDANIDALIAGFVAALKDSAGLQIAPEAAQTYVNQFFQDAQMKEAEETKAQGDKFLAENKTKEGVVTTESGLQYKAITEGTGTKPTAEDQVKVHYTGKLLDGTVFDSSVQRGEPVVFPLNGVIRGWAEGLQHMPVGSKYMLWIPAELAYGMQGVPNQQGGWVIKPNSVLEFEVELLEIVKK